MEPRLKRERGRMCRGRRTNERENTSQGRSLREMWKKKERGKWSQAAWRRNTPPSSLRWASYFFGSWLLFFYFFPLKWLPWESFCLQKEKKKKKKENGNKESLCYLYYDYGTGMMMMMEGEPQGVWRREGKRWSQDMSLQLHRWMASLVSPGLPFWSRMASCEREPSTCGQWQGKSKVKREKERWGTGSSRGVFFWGSQWEAMVNGSLGHRMKSSLKKRRERRRKLIKWTSSSSSSSSSITVYEREREGGWCIWKSQQQRQRQNYHSKGNFTWSHEIK